MLRPILDAINERLNGGHCPTAGCLGECAAIDESQLVGSDSSYYTAHIYLWEAAKDLKAAEVASWFHQLGITEVFISAMLHDPYNDIVEGECTIDGVRPWDVSFFLPEAMKTTTTTEADRSEPSHA